LIPIRYLWVSLVQLLLCNNVCICILRSSCIAENKLTDQNKFHRYIISLADGHWFDGFNHRKNQVHSLHSFITDALYLQKFENNCIIMEAGGIIAVAKNIIPHKNMKTISPRILGKSASEFSSWQKQIRTLLTTW